TSLCFTCPKSPSFYWNLEVYKRYLPLLIRSLTPKDSCLSTLQPHTNYLEGLPEKPKPPHDNHTCQSLFRGVTHHFPAGSLHSLSALAAGPGPAYYSSLFPCF
ncbi:hypothetical protein ILYODFUR_011304, partial [Ilyodon furcidens]